MSSNINAATPTFSMVNSYPFQQPERVFFNPFIPSEMWVTSFGNGMKVGSVLATGVAEFNNVNELQVFPNPSNGVLTILNAAEKQVFVHNTIGQHVYSKVLQDGETQMDVSHLEAGIYFVVCGEKKVKVVLSK